jgi:hypothetical protein
LAGSNRCADHFLSILPSLPTGQKARKHTHTHTHTEIFKKRYCYREEKEKGMIRHIDTRMRREKKKKAAAERGTRPLSFFFSISFQPTALLLPPPHNLCIYKMKGAHNTLK